MLVTSLEVLFFSGMVALSSVWPKTKTKVDTKPPHQPARPELSNYMVNKDGKLEEAGKPQDTSLFL
jgi:hypothetical protein